MSIYKPYLLPVFIFAVGQTMDKESVSSGALEMHKAKEFFQVHDSPMFKTVSNCVNVFKHPQVITSSSGSEFLTGKRDTEYKRSGAGGKGKR